MAHQPMCLNDCIELSDTHTEPHWNTVQEENKLIYFFVRTMEVRGFFIRAPFSMHPF